MRITGSALLIVPLLLLACDREPVAPDTPTPSFSATHGEGVLYGADDVAFFVSCANDGLGEMVHYKGPYKIPFKYIISSSGNWLYKVLDYEYLDGYQITGLTSGDEWTQVDRRVIFNYHSFASGNEVKTLQLLEYLENQDGDRMFANGGSSFTFANGEFHAERRRIVACTPY
jgi:hypothetical protein